MKSRTSLPNFSEMHDGFCRECSGLASKRCEKCEVCPGCHKYLCDPRKVDAVAGKLQFSSGRMT